MISTWSVLAGGAQETVTELLPGVAWGEVTGSGQTQAGADGSGLTVGSGLSVGSGLTEVEGVALAELLGLSVGSALAEVDGLGVDEDSSDSLGSGDALAIGDTSAEAVCSGVDDGDESDVGVGSDDDVSFSDAVADSSDNELDVDGSSVASRDVTSMVFASASSVSLTSTDEGADGDDVAVGLASIDSSDA